MKQDFIALGISTIIITLYLIFLFAKRKEIKLFEQKSKNNFHKQILSPFIYISHKNKDKLSRFIRTKVIIALKNLYGEDDLLKNQIDFMAGKLRDLFYISNIVLIVFAITNNIIILYGGIILIINYSILIDSNIINKYKLENKNFNNDLPNFITRLSLLINVGIRLRTAIQFITENTDGEVVEKFKNVQVLVSNGMSEIEAYNTILIKTDDILIRKFISNIIQNIHTGGDDLEGHLELMKNESNEYKKSQITLKAQEANRKLLLPNLLIFMGILLMVMLPILLNIL